MDSKQPPPPPAYSQPGGVGYSQAPPPPPGYPGSHVVITQPVHMNPYMFREFGVQMQCPQCSATITTSTRYEVGTLTWLACFIIAVVGCWLGCCFIPFCVDGCKDVIHSCPSCNQDVGRYNRM